MIIKTSSWLASPMNAKGSVSPPRLIRGQRVTYAAIRMPVFSNRRNLKPARLSPVSTTVATHLINKTYRSDTVSALRSDRSILSPFSSYRSSYFPTTILMNAPRPAMMSCSAFVHPPG